MRYRSWISRGAFVPGLAGVVMCMIPATAASSDQDRATTPASEWTRIEGGAGTNCAGDSSFAFYVKSGDPHRVMVYFSGGGACWTGATCDILGRPTFDSQIGTIEQLRRGEGILDLANPANPVRDYSIVVIPYCTGDLHLGSRDVTYVDTLPAGGASRTFVTHHQGARNVASALAWVRSHWTAPELIFVTGESAGAVPSAVYAVDVATHYPEARVVQLGDGGGGFRSAALPAILARWGAATTIHQYPAYRSIDSTAITFERLYVAGAQSAPRIRYAQYNNAADQTQRDFLDLLGVHDARLQDLLHQNFAEIRQGNPALRTYTAPGSQHTIVTSAAFYTLSVDGVAIRDWVAALLTGEAVDDVGDALLAEAPQ